MDIEKELKKFLYEWVKKNFGESEADDPSWSITALAHDLRQEYYRLKDCEELDGIKEDIEYVANEDGVELTEQELAEVANEYRYSDGYCAMDDIEGIRYLINKVKGE